MRSRSAATYIGGNSPPYFAFARRASTKVRMSLSGGPIVAPVRRTIGSWLTPSPNAKRPFDNS